MRAFLKKSLLAAVLAATTLTLTACLTKEDKDDVKAPAIISEPVAQQTVDTGVTVKIGLVANGGDLSYLWLKDGFDTVGTSDTLKIPSVKAADAGIYVCVVYNKAGAVTSEVSVLTVNAPANGGGDGDGDGDSTFASTFTAQVAFITPPAGSQPGEISLVTAFYDCDEGDLVTDSSQDNSKYWISGGKLYLWTDGDCLAAKLSGASSSITGTWTTNSLNPTDSVPAAFRAADCATDSDDVEGFFEGTSLQYTITDTKVTAQISGTLCLAGVFGPLYAFTGLGIEVISQGCASVKLRNEDGDTATISSTFKDGNAVLKFSSGTATCSENYYLGLSDKPPVCGEDDEDAFSDCLLGSGFYGHFDLAKKSSSHGMSRKISRILKRAPRLP